MLRLGSTGLDINLHNVVEVPASTGLPVEPYGVRTPNCYYSFNFVFSVIYLQKLI